MIRNCPYATNNNMLVRAMKVSNRKRNVDPAAALLGIPAAEIGILAAEIGIPAVLLAAEFVFPTALSAADFVFPAALPPAVFPAAKIGIPATEIDSETETETEIEDVPR